MDFRFTEEQEMIAQTLQDALSDICTTAQLRQLITAGQTRDDARWKTLADLGVCGSLVAQDAGGLGLDEVTMCRIAESCGAALLPEPMVAHAGVALPLLAELATITGDNDLSGLVAEMAAGKGHAVLFHPNQPFAQGARNARLVLWADADGSITFGPPDAFVLTAQPAVDPLMDLSSCTLGSSANRFEKSAATDAALARAAARGSLFVAAELLGISQAALDLANAYAKERHQFGRPIGSNQAIKHMLAEVQVQISFLRPVLYAAAALFHRDDAFSRGQISHAWLRAVSLVDKSARCAVQVHGAMGYSWETDVHLFLKRGLVLGSNWGSRRTHLDCVTKRAAAGGFL